MFRRRLIRALFLLPLLLCLAGWAWSGTHYASVRYHHAGAYLRAGAQSGTLYLEAGRDHEPNGWRGGIDSAVTPRFWPQAYPAWPTHLGFRFWRFKTVGVDARAVEVPYWFPLVLSALAGLFAWRKTRPQPNPATAFPVEVPVRSRP